MVDLTTPRDLPAVLLIDDDMVSREVLATILTMGGHSVYTAEGGAAALELLAAENLTPGIVLVDAQMPGLSGKALIEKLRTVCQAGIYLISASRPPEEIVAAADGFLMKPFGADALGALPKHPEPMPDPAEPAKNASRLDAEERIVNPETLAQLREMMPAAAVRQLYQAIVADLGRRMTALEAAIAKNDSAEVRRIGHAIKGGCSMAGAMQAARLGGLLEDGLLEKARQEPARPDPARRAPAGRAAGINHLGDSASILSDLRAAARNLERMLKVEFPA